MKKKIILITIISILSITIIFLLIFSFKDFNVANNDLDYNIKDTNLLKFENVNTLVIEYYDLSQHKILNSVEIVNQDEVKSLTKMIEDYKTTPEHLKLHIDGQYVIKISPDIIISFDSLTNPYVKYESSSFSDIVYVSLDFKSNIVEYVNN